MDKQYVAQQFMKGQDCSQVVASHYAGTLGISEDELNRMTAAFGGGLGIGETCGSVAGAMVVLGLKYGHKGADDPENKDVMNAKRAEFLQKWNEKRNSCACRELLGHDISKPGEFDKVLEEGLLFDLCPELVLDAIEILDEIL